MGRHKTARQAREVSTQGTHSQPLPWSQLTFRAVFHPESRSVSCPALWKGAIELGTHTHTHTHTCEQHQPEQTRLRVGNGI